MKVHVCALSVRSYYLQDENVYCTVQINSVLLDNTVSTCSRFTLSTLFLPTPPTPSTAPPSLHSFFKPFSLLHKPLLLPLSPPIHFLPPLLTAMFAMEINVQHDPQTGEQRILSANRVNPLEAASRGVKVYDDGRKVVYEVTSSGGVSTTAVENGWSSEQVDQLVQRAARPVVRGAGAGGGGGDGRRGQVTVTPASPQAYLTSPPQASAEHPVTMVFLGYQDVDDTSESRRLLGFDGAVKAEVVLIDEDDEKSLREKTVTDLSIIDGTAADLVSGRPATSEAVSTELSSDGREPDSASSPPANPDNNAAPPPSLTPATGTDKRKRCECCILM
uniref:Palm2 and akap2 fusion n=1 Tax=Echeneis naucrates TaxID=173247 RepID=A0A665TYS2_ECHNA